MTSRLPVVATARVIRDSRRWFGPGLLERAEARRTRLCVECRKPLATSRTPYCGRKCQWKYHGRFFWDSARIYVMHRDRYTCRNCGIRRRRRDLEIDHILEIARGGAPLSYDNLQTLCKECHREKTIRFLRAGTKLPQSGVEKFGDPEVEWFPA